jgi:hypothetical protein
MGTKRGQTPNTIKEETPFKVIFPQMTIKVSDSDTWVARAYPKTPEKRRTGNKGEYKIRPYKAFPA